MRVVTQLLLELSNFGCLPGRAGGSLDGLEIRNWQIEAEMATSSFHFLVSDF